MVDTNIVIREYLISKASLTDLVEERIYAANPLPENATLPAIAFFTRGGTSLSAVPTVVSPSVQFTCWADDALEARKIYRALYDVLNGLGNAEITLEGINYYITAALEEVQGQDIQDADVKNYWRVVSFYSITIRNY